MKYCKVVFRELPQIVFAHNYQTHHYYFEFSKSKIPHMEITYLHEGDVLRTNKAGTKHISVPALMCSLHDENFSCTSPADFHRHSTVCFIGAYDVTAISDAEVRSFDREITTGEELCIIMPGDGIISGVNPLFEEAISKIILNNSIIGTTQKIKNIANLLMLFAQITEQTIHNAMVASSKVLTPMALHYVSQAEYYIADHIHQKITVPEIAEHLKISTGYLSRLFKEINRQPVLDYILRQKLEIVKQMITEKKCTLREAGQCVGIGDENYLSRIFRKHVGITAQDYRKYKQVHYQNHKG